ncbi:hypothetical protein IP69_08155 [Bosea sp. AAP35]|uniref:DUF4123 domain-containing protein n=1 Tax=Bosea sp. AAP35 TaxID=1523417 RepID=UPI0006B8F453|nr:DUF4123 domain-containing protein [Bosea sp. AAP35]KPF71041.1 hypothetical protein IP69_08155 [Bosea sp. AAP35]
MIAPTDPAGPADGSAALQALPPDWYAVVDGALFVDLAADLAIHGLGGRPLFLEAGDAAAVSSGPFLISLSRADDIDRLRAMNAGRAAPVFWSWPSGEPALFRHLRTLNLVEIPDRQRETPDAPAYEAVVFRHWDTVVLGAMMPLLRPGQMARLLGAAAGVCFGGGSLAAFAGPEAVAADTGMLRFSPDQIARLNLGRVAASRQRIASYLREAAPVETGTMDAAQLQALIVHGENTGRALGLGSERALGKWTYMIAVTDGAVAEGPTMGQVFAGSGLAPDDTLDAVFAEMVAAEEAEFPGLR